MKLEQAQEHSRRSRWLIVTGVVTFATIGLALFLLGASASQSEGMEEAPAGTASGIVVDTSGPVAGATVRQRATENATVTDFDGHFTLESLPEEEIELTAWADGYYVANRFVTPTIAGITLTLRPYHTVDNPDYQWTSPISGTSSGACGNCHPMIVSQWITNAHGGASSNPRFFSMYNGTDLSGTVAIEPGYQDDFPGTAGHCASCHAPGSGLDGYMSTDMNSVRDEITTTVHCDYCHKVGGVYLNPTTDSVYPNMPGAQSQRMLRPPAGDDIFFGPYDDIHDPDTYLPKISESSFCAPCHQFSMWGTPIYESYEEWLASPYAAAGVTCQDCHMPPNGDEFFALESAGGLPHPPETIPSHVQIGANSEALLKDTVTMAVDARPVAGCFQVTVTITNSGAGHHVPTDYPGRHLILTVGVHSKGGTPLTLLEGPVVPDWGGEEAGLPGTAYAKQLQDIETSQVPVVNYWKQTLIAADNRIPAYSSDKTSYCFSLPAEVVTLSVNADLHFRRLLQDVMDAKGWETPDLLMESEHVLVDIEPSHSSFIPLILQ